MIIADANPAVPDFRAAFDALPSPYMILDRRLRYVEANPAYCAVTSRSREELIGRGLFELFPNPGPEGERLRASLERVLATGKPDAIGLIPYPIPLPPERGGGFELRYWSAAHVPLFDGQGRAAWVMQNTVDVTELQRLKTLAFGPEEEPRPGETALLQRTLQVEAANAALRQETQGLRDLFLQAPGFMAVLVGPDLTFTLANNAYQQLIGHRPVVGRPLGEALPEIKGQGFMELLRQVTATGEPYIGNAVKVMLQRSPGAPLEERFLDFIYQPITGASGEIAGVFVQGSDVTDRVRAERQQRLLLDELNHRVKNTLAAVQSIAAQTLRSTPDPSAFRTAFESRLAALSSTHDLLTAASWRSAALRDLLLVELQPYGAERYGLSGPEVDLTAQQALALGLVFHELATNAAKYGALQSGAGRVDLSWSTQDGELRIEWAERGGPPASPPSRDGFGSRLIRASLRGIAGCSRMQFAPEGLLCTLTLPLEEPAAAP